MPIAVETRALLRLADTVESSSRPNIIALRPQVAIVVIYAAGSHLLEIHDGVCGNALRVGLPSVAVKVNRLAFSACLGLLPALRSVEGSAVRRQGAIHPVQHGTGRGNNLLCQVHIAFSRAQLGRNQVGELGTADEEG